jgi:hypothetical protein
MLSLEEMMQLDGHAGPARPIDDAAAAALVGGALDAVFGPAPAGGGGGGGGGGGMAKWIASTATVIGATAVIAVLALREHATTPPQPYVEPAPVVAVQPAPPPAPAPTPAVVVDAEPPEIDITTPDTRPTPPAPPSAKPHVVTPPPAPPAPPVATPQRAEDLLALANAARTKRAWADADALYSRVVDEHAGSKAAATAAAASGSLRLEHLRDPRGGLARFKLALGSPLDEEARYGIAEAEHALGDRDAEAKALADFLAHHADSPLAPRAQERQKALAH